MKCSTGFDAMNHIGIPHKLLEKILESSNIIYDIILKTDIQSNSFISLFILCIIRSKAEFLRKLEQIKLYSDVDFSAVHVSTPAYFVEQLQLALEILDSSPYRALLENDSEESIQFAISKSESMIPTATLTSFSDILSFSEDSESSLIKNEEKEEETEDETDQQEKTQKIDDHKDENQIKILISNNSGGQNNNFDNNSCELFFPRAIITNSSLSNGYMELPVVSGQIVDITSGNPDFVINPVALDREELYCASYAGCVGWIPKE